ncbi:MAG TPA: hypothetical protein DEB46_00135, partial [Myxococcales bacterium]|nr:hypothetical protein [Myxococcales bacterium]
TQLIAAKIAAGDRHSCALTPTGSVYCWGANDQGQSGQFNDEEEPDWPTVFEPMQVPLNGEAVDIALGSRHSCAKLSDGELKCWGYAGTNALGRWAGGDDACAGEPSKNVGAVLGLPETPIHSISAGLDTSCALLTDGEIYCWGDNGLGQLGQGEAARCQTNPQPTAVRRNLATGSIDRFHHVSTGNAVTCAIGSIEDEDEESVWCWGSNEHGRLGINVDNLDIVRREPARLGGLGELLSPAALTTGLGEHACIFSQESTLCWGAGIDFQLGNCNRNNAVAPVEVQDVCNL